MDYNNKLSFVFFIVSDLWVFRGHLAPIANKAARSCWNFPWQFPLKKSRLKHQQRRFLGVNTYGGFLKWWYPQITYSNRVFHYKPSILGYHHLRKHPYVTIYTFICVYLWYNLIISYCNFIDDSWYAIHSVDLQFLDKNRVLECTKFRQSDLF